jgi:hypothetical protein
MVTMDLNAISTNFGMPMWFFIALIIWIIFWKGLALWRAGRKNQPIWFILILLINTFGIFEILYIFLFSKIKLNNFAETTKPKNKSRRKK